MLLSTAVHRGVRQLTTTTKYDKLSVGVPRESFPHERRVAITPDKVASLKKSGVAEVRVESGAGAEASFTDQAYAAAGALIVKREQAFSSDVVFKVRIGLQILVYMSLDLTVLRIAGPCSAR